MEEIKDSRKSVGDMDFKRIEESILEQRKDFKSIDESDCKSLGDENGANNVGIERKEFLGHKKYDVQKTSEEALVDCSLPPLIKNISHNERKHEILKRNDSKENVNFEENSPKSSEASIINKNVLQHCRLQDFSLATSTECDHAHNDRANITGLNTVNEKTPEKAVNNKISRKRFNSESVRRSSRVAIKPQRYADPKNFICNKRRKSSGSNVTISKPSATKNAQSINDIQNTPNVELKTPIKSCTKALFRGKKWNVKKNMQDLLMEFSSQRQVTPPLLSLNDMSVAQVMETFESTKSKLNALFQKICHIDYVKKYEDIDHYLVIELLPIKVQNAMMNKLSDLYETEQIPKYATHFANVLMPEWILCIFMKRFNMTREQSIDCIKQQNSSNIKYIDWDSQDDVK